jgi:hypothetical protein
MLLQQAVVVGVPGRRKIPLRVRLKMRKKRSYLPETE